MDAPLKALKEDSPFSPDQAGRKCIAIFTRVKQETKKSDVPTAATKRIKTTQREALEKWRFEILVQKVR